jgi:protein-tyrosine-phosphatase
MTGWSAGPAVPSPGPNQSSGRRGHGRTSIDISREYPKPWPDKVVQAADVVITMGCGDACPIFPGKRYEDWTFDDPAGKGVDQVRPIRDQIERRVRDLLDNIGVPASA